MSATTAPPAAAPAAPPATARIQPGAARSGAAGVARAARVAFLGAVALFFAVPVLWLLLAPTKTAGQLYTRDPLAFGSLGNVPRAWNNLMTYNNGEILDWIRNSVVYTLGSVAVALVLCIPAGYALAKYDFPGRRLVLVLTLVGFVIPSAALVLPLFLEMAAVHLLGTSWSVILPLGFYPFGVYLAYLYFSANLPDELIDAGRLDGAGEAQLFLRIALPLARPVTALIAFFCFVRAWTDFFLPYVMLADDRTFTLQLGLQDLLESTGAVNGLSGFAALPIHQPEAALAALVAVAPILVAFLFSQRFLVAGHLAGAQKE